MELCEITRPWSTPGGIQILPANADRLDRQHWLQTRRRHLCASEIGMMLNLDESRYGGAFTLWSEKVGVRPLRASNDAQQFGLDMEDAIIKHWLHITDRPMRFRNVGMIRSKTYKRAAANVDRLSICPAGRCITEIKTAADASEWYEKDHAGDEAYAEIPLLHQFQGQWQIFCTGRDHVHFLCLGPRHQIIERVMYRDDALIMTLLIAGAKFWRRHVIPGNPPEANRNDHDAIREIVGQPDQDAEYVLSADDVAAEHWVRHCDEVIKRLKTRRDDLTARLQARVGNATEVLWPDRKLAATFRASSVVVDGADKGWRKEHPDIVEANSTEVIERVFDARKALENHPELLASGLRYRRSFTRKPIKGN